ncbi:hypothetical protein Tempeh6L_06990, partial [Lactococcus lactis subsp. lactis]
NPDGTITLPGQDGKTGTGDDGKVKPNGPSISNPDGNITLPGGGTVQTPGGTIDLPEGTVIDPDGTIHLPNGEIINPDGTITGKNTKINTSNETQNSTLTPLGTPVGISTSNTKLPKTGDVSLSSEEALALGFGALLGVLTLTEVKRRKEN